MSNSITEVLKGQVNLKRWCDTFVLVPTAIHEDVSTVGELSLHISDSLRLYTEYPNKFNELQELAINLDLQTQETSQFHITKLLKNSINHIISSQILTTWELELPLIFNHHQRIRIHSNMKHLTTLAEISGVEMGLDRLLIKENELRFLLLDLKSMSPKRRSQYLKGRKFVANLMLFD